MNSDQLLKYVQWRDIEAQLQGKLLTIFSVGLMAGVLVYIGTSWPIWPWLLGGAWLVCIGAIGQYVSRDTYYSFSTLSAFCFGLVLGIIVAHAHAHAKAAPRIEAPTNPVYVEGWVNDIDYGQNGPRLRLLVHAIEALPKQQTPRYVRVTHISKLEVSAGQFVRCWSILRPPPRPSIPGDFDFRRKAWFEQLGGVGYVRGKCRGGSLGTPTSVRERFSVSLAAIRFAISRYVAAKTLKDTAGISAALITGDKSGLDPQHVEDLRTVGLSHLLAISGLHLGMVCGLAFGLFRGLFAIVPWLSNRMPSPYAGAIGALFCGTIYLLLSGGSVSTQRAYIMSTIFFGAMLMDRNALSLRGLTLALILVLLLQPQSIVSAGFQMSFAATGALIMIYASWNRYRYENSYAQRSHWFRFFIASLCVTSFVAGLATLPFAYYHFGRTAPMSFLANIIVMPIISMITAPSATFAALTYPLDGGSIGLSIYSQSLNWVVTIAGKIATLSRDIFGEGPFKPINMPLASAVMLMVAFLVSLYRFSRANLIMAALVAVFASAYWFFSANPVAYLARSGEVFWTDETGKWRSTQVIDGDAMSPMKMQGFVSPIASCDHPNCDLEAMRGEDWPDTQTLFARGALIYKSRAGWRHEMDACGKRIWNPCHTRPLRSLGQLKQGNLEH